MDRKACTDPQCLYKGALYLTLYLSWTLFVYSHDKGMVSYLLQCDAVSLKVTENLQSVTRVLCLCQPSIILLSVFVYI